MMRIEKFVHSCLRLSLGGERLLFDPGRFSFVDGRVTVAQLGRPSTVVLTHGHPDHVDLDALRQLTADGARIVGNGDVQARLAKEGLEIDRFDEGERSFGPFRVSAIPVEHEPILSEQTPATTAFLVNGLFLNPADSFDHRLDRYAGVTVLALPVMAPFLTELAAFAFAKRMRPKAVLPVHDGYARDYFLSQRYDAY